MGKITIKFTEIIKKNLIESLWIVMIDFLIKKVDKNKTYIDFELYGGLLFDFLAGNLMQWKLKKLWKA